MFLARPFALACAALFASSAAQAQTYQLAAPIPVPGDGGWDYAHVDPAAHRLYVAHGDEVAVVDLATMRAGVPLGPVARGHAVVPLATHELAVTSGNDSTVRFFDPSHGRQTASVAVDRKPDAAIVDPANGHLLTMNAAGGSVAEIDPTSHRLIRTIRVKPGLEFAAIHGRTLYINNEEANEIEVIDLATGTMRKPIALPGCEEPSGLGLDAAHARLVSACANGVAAVVDLKSARLVQTVPIGRGPDAVLIDARRSVALIPAGADGVLDVLDLSAPGKVTHKASIATERGARTGAIDPGTGNVYLPTARLAPPAAGSKRPSAMPGTFHIVVVKPL
ncbi:MAG: YncE family protein [Candidatus Sphingomonas colombiensis]|nr:YncE family protein [Sphingomonas sp.]WEK42492.1 MAG: YncE family protein [Sphingomonas sp.]